MASVNMETANGTVQLATMEDLKAMQTSISNSMGGKLVWTGTTPDFKGNTTVSIPIDADYVILIHNIKGISSSGSLGYAYAYQYRTALVKGCTARVAVNMNTSTYGTIGGNATLNEDGNSLHISGMGDQPIAFGIEAYSYT